MSTKRQTYFFSYFIILLTPAFDYHLIITTLFITGYFDADSQHSLICSPLLSLLIILFFIIILHVPNWNRLRNINQKVTLWLPRVIGVRDWYVNPPHNFNDMSVKQVLRIKNIIRKKRLKGHRHELCMLDFVWSRAHGKF